MAARLPPRGLPSLAHDGRAEVAERQVSEDRFPGDHLLLGAEAEEARQHRSGRSGAPAHVREARRADERAGEACRCRRRRRFRQRVGRHHVQGKARRGRHPVLLDLGSRAEASGNRPQVPGDRGPVERQLLRGAQLGGVHRRLVLLHPEGRQVPDGPVDVLPHQHAGLRAVRAHADHRRGRRVGVVPRRLHGAEVRHQSAPCGGRRARRAGARRHQVLDGAELVRGRRERRGRHLQLRHQARAVQGRRLAHLVDAGRDRIGDHVEVPELRAARRQLGRRVLLGRAHQQPPAGRHGDQDGPHRPQHAEHDRQQGDLGRSTPTTATAGSSRSGPRPKARATTRNATRC